MQPSSIFAPCSVCGEQVPGAGQAFRCRCARESDPEGTRETFRKLAYGARTDFEARYFRRKLNEFEAAVKS